LLQAGVLSVVQLLFIPTAVFGAVAWWLFWIFSLDLCVGKIQMCQQMRGLFHFTYEFVPSFFMFKFQSVVCF
jgi:hypothetical protein